MSQTGLPRRHGTRDSPEGPFHGNFIGGAASTEDREISARQGVIRAA